MKKLKLDPLALDKETISKLDEAQLLEIVGGVLEDFAATSGPCNQGYSDCGSTGTSSGCTGSASRC
jgi:hypothetical protein